MNLSALEAELDRWTSQPTGATLWWRDDDAVAATPALDRLLGLCTSHGVPLALAVVPARLQSSVVKVIDDAPLLTVLQHGFAHANHAPPNAKKSELTTHRPREATFAELARGHDRLTDAFGSRHVPVLVPPWNRIDASLVAALPEIGLDGLSTFGPRAQRTAAATIVQCNTHVDPISWRAGRRFIGGQKAAERIAQHLRERREGVVDATEPTGLLTHHLDFDDDAFAFVDALFAMTQAHAATSWLAATDALTFGRSA
ncbi:MAG TPA: polysaccharide deacetylase family protein [Casimicrobiaceae bacterium]|nr:polysaccharide deacetylase family protein [Casimicrobiaceae bacterium]